VLLFFKSTYCWKDYTNHRHKIVQATKFYTVVPNTCEYSVWDLLHVTLLGIENFEVVRFLENLCTPGLRHWKLIVPNFRFI
jgi:hypothetical protein